METNDFLLLHVPFTSLHDAFIYGVILYILIKIDRDHPSFD